MLLTAAVYSLSFGWGFYAMALTTQARSCSLVLGLISRPPPCWSQGESSDGGLGSGTLISRRSVSLHGGLWRREIVLLAGEAED